MTSPRDPTQFTRESAERIANVVRAAELATPGARPVNFERVDFFKAKLFRVATYTGTWSTGTLKTVTFKNVTNTPNTASVTNLFFPVTNTAAGNRDCAIAKEGTAWYLIDVLMATATQTQVTVITNVSLGTAGLRFTRAVLTVMATATQSIQTISTTACT